MKETLIVLETITKGLSKTARHQSKLLKELKEELKRLADYYDKCAHDDAISEDVEEQIKTDAVNENAPEVIEAFNEGSSVEEISKELNMNETAVKNIIEKGEAQISAASEEIEEGETPTGL